MARSVWKGPFVEESLIKKVEQEKNNPKRKPIKTWSRKSTILPDFVGISFLIYNGKKFIPIQSQKIWQDINLVNLLLQDNFLAIRQLIKKQKKQQKPQLKNKNEKRQRYNK